MLTRNNEALMPTPSPATRAEVKQVGKFGIVGILNTVLDFAIYNILHFGAGFGLIPANIISTTCAMAFSFVANKRLVFKHRHGSMARQAGIFFAVTAFGLYVLQNGTITLLTEVWPWPLHLMVQIGHFIGLQAIFPDVVVVNNGAKAIATLVSLTWNYVLYKKVVFKQ
jgi:putative flippase GtrA